MYVLCKLLGVLRLPFCLGSCDQQSNSSCPSGRGLSDFVYQLNVLLLMLFECKFIAFVFMSCEMVCICAATLEFDGRTGRSA